MTQLPPSHCTVVGFALDWCVSDLSTFGYHRIRERTGKCGVVFSHCMGSKVCFPCQAHGFEKSVK